MSRILILFCILAATFCPTVTRAQEVPQLTGQVVDQAGILTPAAESSIVAILKAHEDSTSNQIAVLTIRSLSGEAIETYSLRVARTWGLGTAELDNGVLVLVALDDREMRIEVGLGLEGMLTDSRANRIIRGDMRSRFREGNYDAGVLSAVQNIVGVLDGTYDPPEPDGLGTAPFLFGLAFLIVPGIFMLIGMVSRGGSKWFLYVFLIPFFLIGGTVVTGSFTGGWIVIAIYSVIYIGSEFHPKIRAARKGEIVKFGPFSVSGMSGSSGSGWSSSSGGGSSFSGGGGSFGGGGSSGSW